jgi:hypothetical protein
VVLQLEGIKKTIYICVKFETLHHVNVWGWSEWWASCPSMFIFRETVPDAHWMGGLVGPKTCVNSEDISCPCQELIPCSLAAQPTTQSPYWQLNWLQCCTFNLSVLLVFSFCTAHNKGRAIGKLGLVTKWACRWQRQVGNYTFGYSTIIPFLLLLQGYIAHWLISDFKRTCYLHFSICGLERPAFIFIFEKINVHTTTA